MPTNQMKSFVFFSKTGCLLPLLIFLNLFFGWLFFEPHYWLGIEGVLVLLFVLNALILTRKITSSLKTKKTKGVIDVEGGVVEEKRKKLAKDA